MAEKKWNVVWSDSAARELIEIASRSRSKEPGLLESLREEAAHLERSPERGPIVAELASLGVRDWREWVVDSYRIVYRIGEQSVRVGALIDGRRDLEDLLLERLI